MARWGLVIVAIYALIAVVTPSLLSAGWLPDPNAGLDNPIYAPPSLQHWCGTDRLGRDVCVRTLQGSGVALQVVLLAVAVALVIGVPLGMVSGYLGGAVDRVLVLLMDTLYTLPVLLLSVVLAFLLGRGVPTAAALCVVYVPQYFRVVRNQTAQVKAELFVEAARTLGAGPVWILRRYLLRNVITSVPVLLTLNAADAVLVLGGLALGLGLPETVPEWAVISIWRWQPCPPASGGQPSIPAWRCSCWCWGCRSWVRVWKLRSAALAATLQNRCRNQSGHAVLGHRCVAAPDADP